MRITGRLALALALLVPSIAHAQDAPASTKKQPSLSTVGIALFGLSYGLSVGVSTASYRDENGSLATKMLVPVVGPWLVLADDKFDHDTTVSMRLIDGLGARDCSAPVCMGALLLAPVVLIEYGLLVLDPIAQATGLVMAMVGANPSPSPRPTFAPKAKVNVKPTFVGTGPGVALSITEW